MTAPKTLKPQPSQARDLSVQKSRSASGDVDILFGEVPVELKARRGQKTALIDTLIVQDGPAVRIRETK